MFPLSRFPAFRFSAAFLVSAVFAVTTVACHADDISGSVKSITLPQIKTDLPEGPGRTEFMAACLSCHSARYMITQPPFPPHKWGEIATKMIKTYGANIDDAQIAAIVDYLSQINGAPENQPVTNAPPRPEVPLQIVLPADAAARVADQQHGAAVFAQSCAGCHGPAGRGDGIVSPILQPQPANLTAVQFSPALLEKVLWNGVPGTCMPSWRSLTPADANSLAFYVLNLHPAPAPAMTVSDTAGRGKTLYTQICAACHSATGDANTPAAKALAPAPTNFQIEQPDVEYVEQVLRDGIPGTAMPSWKAIITEPDRAALAHYVRSFYNPPGGGK